MADINVTLGTARLTRQRLVAEWCRAAFGGDQAASVPQRALRLLEESVEAFQVACGQYAVEGASNLAHGLIDHVFSRPEGALDQELGGIGVTVLALAETAGLDADICEVREIRRVMGKPLAHFASRNAAKNELGFLIGGDK